MKVNKIATILGAMLLAAGATGCSFVKYSFSGASIPQEAQTFAVGYFPNNAMMVNPTLSSTLGDELADRISRQTRLVQAGGNETGDLSFEGEITGYTSAPSVISGTPGQEGAVTNRLTITVNVRFTSALQPERNFEKRFSSYADYPSSTLLQSAEPSLIPEIVELIVTDIFNEALSYW